MTRLRIVHELPQRLRLQLPTHTPVQLADLAASLRTRDGVRAVRANRACRSLIVDYDGGLHLRAHLLAQAGAPSSPPAVAGASAPEPADSPDGAQLALSAAVVVASWLLPRPLAAALTVANVAGPVLTGVAVALTRGLRVEVLSALALGFSTGRGEYATANTARFLMELANYIEASTAARSDDLLRTLLRRRPDNVWVEQDVDGRVETRQVPFALLRGGERVVVGLGETVPVDGSVVAGAAYVDQSAVTGESLPLPRGSGDEALAGGVVTEGRLVIRAERVGAATTTGRITRYIEEALAQPAAIQSASDRFADRRVGITLASAAAVLVLTRDWRRLESVLMVDYACTVKLGTPIAIKSALYRAGQEGCLVKNGQALESLGGVDMVVFDKTGTLTHNTLEVTDICPLTADVDEEAALAVVASLGEHTTHPIARAVVGLARERRLAHVPHEEVNFIVGHGVQAVVDGATVRFGSRHYLEDDEEISFAPQRALVAAFEAEGKSLLYVARDERPLAVIALRDTVRAESRAVVARLRAAGVRRIVMLTGDRHDKALAIGAALGMDAVFSEQQPEDKATVIAGLKAEGARVAYVGDGVNDGPALIAADVGIAMPRAADIARATADVVLLEERLDALADLFVLSRRTVDLIHANFRVAVGVNTAILLGAVSGRLAPLPTAILHNGTTVAVLLRSLLVARARRTARSQRGVGSDRTGQP